MNFKKLSLSLVLAAAGIMAANAGSIDVNAARQAANNFLKSKMTAQGMMKAPAIADIKLAHTEASSVEGNAFYVIFYLVNIPYPTFSYVIIYIE